MTSRWLWLLPPLGVIAIMICDSKPSPIPPDVPPPPPTPPAPPAVSPRARVVAAALSQVGQSDPQKYWAEVAPGVVVQKGTDWCGGFALWALHQAGLALDRKWIFGKGFILVGPKPLPTTRSPIAGDILYANKNQHQAIVSAVNGDVVSLVNGNGTGGRVSVSTLSKAAHLAGNPNNAFFSIQRLIDELPPRQPSGNA